MPYILLLLTTVPKSSSTSKTNPTTYKKDWYNDQVEFFPRMQGWFNIWKLINALYHINGIKDKHQMILPIDKTCLTKIQYPFMMKTLYKLSVEGNFLNLIRNIYEKPRANIILDGKRLNAFSLRSWPSQRCSFSSLLFNIDLKVLVREIRQEKK